MPEDTEKEPTTAELLAGAEAGLKKLVADAGVVVAAVARLDPTQVGEADRERYLLAVSRTQLLAQRLENLSEAIRAQAIGAGMPVEQLLKRDQPNPMGGFLASALRASQGCNDPNCPVHGRKHHEPEN